MEDLIGELDNIHKTESDISLKNDPQIPYFSGRVPGSTSITATFKDNSHLRRCLVDDCEGVNGDPLRTVFSAGG
jgi:hypothetical protein